MIGLSHTKISMILWRIIEPSNWPKIHLYVANNTTNTLSSRLHWAQYHCLWSHVIATKPPTLICCHCHILAVAISSPLPYFHCRHTVAKHTTLNYFYSNCTLPPIPCCPYLAAHTSPLILCRSYLATHKLQSISYGKYIDGHILTIIISLLKK